jgi:hypothetical protein
VGYSGEDEHVSVGVRRDRRAVVRAAAADEGRPSHARVHDQRKRSVVAHRREPDLVGTHEAIATLDRDFLAADLLIEKGRILAEIAGRGVQHELAVRADAEVFRAAVTQHRVREIGPGRQHQAVLEAPVVDPIFEVRPGRDTCVAHGGKRLEPGVPARRVPAADQVDTRGLRLFPLEHECLHGCREFDAHHDTRLAAVAGHTIQHDRLGLEVDRGAGAYEVEARRALELPLVDHERGRGSPRVRAPARGERGSGGEASQGQQEGGEDTDCVGSVHGGSHPGSNARAAPV